MSDHTGSSESVQPGDLSRIFVVVFDPQLGRTNSISDFSPDESDRAREYLQEQQDAYADMPHVEVTYLTGTRSELERTHARYFSNAPQLAVPKSLLRHLRRNNARNLDRAHQGDRGLDA